MNGNGIIIHGLVVTRIKRNIYGLFFNINANFGKLDTIKSIVY